MSKPKNKKIGVNRLKHSKQVDHFTEAAILEEAREDFTLFFLLVYGDVRKLYPFTKEMLAIAQRFEDENKRGLVFAASPRSGKTEAFSQLFAAWTLGRHPTENIALVSYSEDRSVDNSLRVRDIITTKIYKQIFPWVALDKAQKAKTNFRITKGGELYALGRNSPVTGRTFHLIIIDDIIKDANEMNSESIRDMVNRSIDTLRTRITNKTRLIVVGTSWYQGDAIDVFRKEAQDYPNDWIIAKYPAIAIEDERSIIDGSIWRKKGEAVLPAVVDEITLEKIRSATAPAVWEAVYQQNPPNDEVYFQRSWLQYISKDELKQIPTRKFLTIDPAMSVKESADRTGFCIAHLAQDGTAYIQAWGDRLDPRSLVDKIFALHDEYHFELIGIEKFSFSEGLKPFIEDQMLQRNVFLPLKQLSHSNKSKEARITTALPGLYASGMFKHIEGETDLLETEMFQFPRGDHDDVLDATAYMAALLAHVGGKTGDNKRFVPIDWSKR